MGNGALKAVGKRCDVCGAEASAHQVFASEAIPFRGRRTYCPPCHARLFHRILVGLLVSLGLMGAWGLILLLRNPASEPGHVFLNLFVLQVCMALSILPHELGHALTARWLGLPVRKILVGYGRRLLATRLGGFEVEFNRLPMGGLTLVEFKDLPGIRRRWLAMVAAGPLTNVVLAAVVWILFVRTESVHWGFGKSVPIPLLFVLGNLALVVENLLPFVVVTSYGPVASDGLTFWRLAVGSVTNTARARKCRKSTAIRIVGWIIRGIGALVFVCVGLFFAWLAWWIGGRLGIVLREGVSKVIGNCVGIVFLVGAALASWWVSFRMLQGGREAGSVEQTLNSTSRIESGKSWPRIIRWMMALALALVGFLFLWFTWKHSVFTVSSDERLDLNFWFAVLGSLALGAMLFWAAREVLRGGFSHPAVTTNAESPDTNTCVTTALAPSQHPTTMTITESPDWSASSPLLAAFFGDLRTRSPLPPDDPVEEFARTAFDHMCGGRLAEALRALEVVRQRLPDNSWALYHQAILLTRLGRHEESECKFLQLQNQPGWRVESLAYIAAERLRCQLRQGRFEAARDLCAEILATSSEIAVRVQVLDFVACLPIEESRRDCLSWALEAIELALNLAPENLSVKGNKGALLVELGRYDEGEALLRQTYTKSPLESDRAISAFYLALIVQHREKFDLAQLLVREARLCRSVAWLPQRIRQAFGDVT